MRGILAADPTLLFRVKWGDRSIYPDPCGLRMLRYSRSRSFLIRPVMTLRLPHHDPTITSCGVIATERIYIFSNIYALRARRKIRYRNRGFQIMISTYNHKDTKLA
ncbi:MAG: hypothetical protein H0X33_07455 [Taibaiella sp.]|nr:hypothetical protein [Taibaiella sp.]